MLYLSLLLLFSGNKKKGIKSSIGRLFGKKDKPQTMGKDGQMTPPVIPGQHIYSTWSFFDLQYMIKTVFMRNLWECIALYLELVSEFCLLLLNCRFWDEHWRYHDPGQASWERPQDEEEVHVLSTVTFFNNKIHPLSHPCTFNVYYQRVISFTRSDNQFWPQH